ncbi:MAG: TraR/DksA family transcriptional regulator [Halobacteriovoraceae bacterium]|nr:TraR/DksA family transcriptional regulator [Halobacteriovoraceae bacterium]
MARENSYLTEEQVEELRSMLLKEKESTIASLKEKTTNYSIQNSETKDCVDEANENILVSQNVRFTNRDHLYLKKLMKSIGKIKSGEYGICDECSSQIPFSRLKARLTSDLCIVCKEEAEMEEKHNYFGRRSKSLGREIQYAR